MDEEINFRQIGNVLDKIREELSDLAPCEVSVFTDTDELRIMVHWTYEKRDIYFIMQIPPTMPVERLLNPARLAFAKQTESLDSEQDVLSRSSYISEQLGYLVECAREVGRVEAADLGPIERTEAIEGLAHQFLPEILGRCQTRGYPTDDIDNILSTVHHSLAQQLEHAQR